MFVCFFLLMTEQNWVATLGWLSLSVHRWEEDSAECQSGLIVNLSSKSFCTHFPCAFLILVLSPLIAGSCCRCCCCNCRLFHSVPCRSRTHPSLFLGQNVEMFAARRFCDSRRGSWTVQHGVTETAAGNIPEACVCLSVCLPVRLWLLPLLSAAPPQAIRWH